MQDHTHRSTFVWKEKSKTMDFKLDSSFPQCGFSNLNFKPIQLSRVQQTGKGVQNTPTSSHTTSEWPSNNLKQVEFTFYFKKRERTYMRGERGEQQLSETRFLPFLPTVTNCVWISMALACWCTIACAMNRLVNQGNIFKVEAEMEIVRYHTQCRFIVHSMFFF